MMGEQVDGAMQQITQIDSEGVQDMMREFGNALAGLGYPFVQEEIEGGGDVGSAVADPVSHGDVMVIAGYLKEIAQELMREPASEERTRALQIAQKAWAHLRTLVR